MECNLWDSEKEECKAGLTSTDYYAPTPSEFHKYCTGAFRECPRLMTFISGSAEAQREDPVL